VEHVGLQVEGGWVHGRRMMAGERSRINGVGLRSGVAGVLGLRRRRDRGLDEGFSVMTDQTATYAALTEIFNDVFMKDMQLTPELSAKDVPGWDSFKQIEIIISCEERFGIKLNTREIDSLKNVGDLAKVIESKKG
jgi:acyl carrier protein